MILIRETNSFLIGSFRFAPNLSFSVIITTRDYSVENLVVVAICTLSTPPPQAGCDTRSIFKGSKADFNLEFSFKTGCHITAK